LRDRASPSTGAKLPLNGGLSDRAAHGGAAERVANDVDGVCAPSAADTNAEAGAGSTEAGADDATTTLLAAGALFASGVPTCPSFEGLFPFFDANTIGARRCLQGASAPPTWPCRTGAGVLAVNITEEGGDGGGGGGVRLGTALWAIEDTAP